MLLYLFVVSQYNNCQWVIGIIAQNCVREFCFSYCNVYFSFNSTVKLCLKGKYVKRYFNKKINRCIISKSRNSQICNVGNSLLL